MDGWKQWFVVLLPLCVHADAKETGVKTIKREPDVSPVCTSENLGVIVSVSCPISAERHRGEVCRLLYRCDKQLDDECNSKFSLINKNQTVSIHLTSLTPVDGGNSTCECCYERGVDLTQPNTMDEDDDTIFGTKFISAVIIILSVATISFITAGIICCHVLRRNHHRENTSSGAVEFTRHETTWFLDQEDLYTSLQHPTTDVYHTIYSSCHYCDVDADPASSHAVIHQETDGKELDCHSVYTDYETI